MKYKWKALLLGIFSSVLFLLFTLLANFKFCFFSLWQELGRGRESENTITKEVQRFLFQIKVVQTNYFFVKPGFLKPLFLLKGDVFYWLYSLTIYCIMWKEWIGSFSNTQCNSVLEDTGYTFQLCHDILLS